MKIESCKTNHWSNPLGIWFRNITLSWVVSEGVSIEQRIRIWAGDTVCYDTGWAELDARGTTIPLNLKACTRYNWTVRVRDAKGCEAESEKQSFETGKMSETWMGYWITCEKENPRHPVFRKKFKTEKNRQIRQARMYICGLGLYEAYLNGGRIGDSYLTPGCNSYDHYVQVQTYDVTSMLQETEYVIEVLLGPGWYNGRFGFADNVSDEKGYRLIAELHIQYEDGTQQVIPTDDTWTVGRSNLIFSNIYDGEMRDDTLKEEEEVPAEIFTGQMPPLQDALSVPVRAQERLAVELLHTPEGENVLDTRQNMAGIFELRVKEPEGQKIHLQFGEVLQDGNFYRENLRGAKAEYVYISDGEEHVLRPHFTFYGYRYVKVEGIPELKAEDFTAVALYSDILMTGKIHTGNAKINQLISNTLWGMKSNFVDIPTDCPQRDERMGWTGDTQAFSETAFYLADPYAFYRKYLYDCEKEQLARNGAVPDVLPPFGMDSVSSVWGDVTCILPWNMYLAAGDKSILEEHYESMKQWVDYIGKIDGADHGWRRHFHYGDWLALDSALGDNLQGGTDTGFIADVYYRKSALITAKTARLLGKTEEAAQYETQAERILEGIREEYYSPNGRCCIPTQTAALLTISEELNDRERAKKALAHCLEERHDKLATGFVGTPLLCVTLADNGMEDKAYRLLLNEAYPGWLYAVNLGATTIWERWNSLDETGHISSTGMNSLNHYTYGSIVSWIWKGAAGIRPCEEEPGYRKVLIRPIPNWKLGEMEATLPTASGTYHVYWKVEGEDQVRLRLTIPDGCHGEVELYLADIELLRQEQPENPLLLKVAAEKCLVEGGSYEITYHTVRPLIRHLTVETSLGELIREPELADLLYKEIDELAHLLSYTEQYPLGETLRNLHYDSGFISRLNKEISQKPL